MYCRKRSRVANERSPFENMAALVLYKEDERREKEAICCLDVNNLNERCSARVDTRRNIYKNARHLKPLLPLERERAAYIF